jgi:hypothetical protein
MVIVARPVRESISMAYGTTHEAYTCVSIPIVRVIVEMEVIQLVVERRLLVTISGL